MAVAERKKTVARETRQNHPEYDAFVERGRTLTKFQMHPFNHALRRLCRYLNNQLRFEALALMGVTEIIVIADELRSRQFRRHFPPVRAGVGGKKLKNPRPNPLAEWVAGFLSSRGVKKYAGFRSIKSKDPLDERQTEVLRARLTLLKETLNKRESRHALAAIGSCALSVYDPEDHPEPNGHPAILISNFIPGCIPNSDFSIVPEGSRPDAPNGIWEHS